MQKSEREQPEQAVQQEREQETRRQPDREYSL
jgi:hypothetical protein